MVSISSNNIVSERYALYRELEKKIEATKWFEILKRKKLKQQLLDARQEGFSIGMEMAIKDLVECGILKKVKK